METKTTLIMNSALNNLDQRGKIIAEYIWMDGSLQIRGKARTLDGPITDIS